MKASIWKAFDFERRRGHLGRVKILFVNQSAPFYHWWCVMEIFYLWGLFIDWQKATSERKGSKEICQLKCSFMPLMAWRSFTFKVCSLADKFEVEGMRLVNCQSRCSVYHWWSVWAKIPLRSVTWLTMSKKWEGIVKGKEVKKLPAKVLPYAIGGLEIFYL